jgi:hypothetical protein
MEEPVQEEHEAHQGSLMAQPMKTKLGVHNKDSKEIGISYP